LNLRIGTFDIPKKQLRAFAEGRRKWNANVIFGSARDLMRQLAETTEDVTPE
jgi:hypothetical protein